MQQDNPVPDIENQRIPKPSRARRFFTWLGGVAKDIVVSLAKYAATVSAVLVIYYMAYIYTTGDTDISGLKFTWPFVAGGGVTCLSVIANVLKRRLERYKIEGLEKEKAEFAATAHELHEAIRTSHDIMSRLSVLRQKVRDIKALTPGSDRASSASERPEAEVDKVSADPLPPSPSEQPEIIEDILQRSHDFLATHPTLAGYQSRNLLKLYKVIVELFNGLPRGFAAALAGSIGTTAALGGKLFDRTHVITSFSFGLAGAILVTLGALFDLGALEVEIMRLEDDIHHKREVCEKDRQLLQDAAAQIARLKEEIISLGRQQYSEFEAAYARQSLQRVPAQVRELLGNRFETPVADFSSRYRLIGAEPASVAGRAEPDDEVSVTTPLLASNEEGWRARAAATKPQRASI